MQFFDIELSSYSPDTAPFYAILVSALLAFFLSSLIAITYDRTTKSIYKRAHFQQSLAMIGVVAATIMQAIGDSVAIGLGILGALSIIRFRTALNDPRNITFMFASIGSGIAVGVFGFSIALVGTLVFCLAAIVLRFTALSNNEELIGELRLNVPKNESVQKEIETILKSFCINYELEQLRFLNPKKMTVLSESGEEVIEEVSRENLQQFTYLIRLRKNKTVSMLTSKMHELEGLENLRLNFTKQPTRL